MIEKTCEVCDGKFMVKDHRASSAKFCSRVCKGQAFSSAKNSKRFLTCASCGKPFKAVLGQRERFCTRDCYERWVQANRKCEKCGTERCKDCARQRTAMWRKQATKYELKARSMQTSFRQASGRTLTLPLDDARQLVMNPPDCPYCKKPIPWEDLSIDHKMPTSRGGSNEPSNLVWVDIDCNLVKGNMTDSEYVELLSFLERHQEIAESLKQRLRAGGGAIFNRNRRTYHLR